MDRKPSQRAWLGAWLGVTATFVGWWVVVYGIFGHVCPFAFVGIWLAAIFGGRALHPRRVPWWGLFVSLVFVLAAWVGAWFVHGPEEVRHVTPEPHAFLALAYGGALAIHYLLARRAGPAGPVSSWPRGHVRRFGYGNGILSPLVGVAYLVVPQVKEWLDQGPDGAEWFDTVFQQFDVYYLFTYVAAMCVAFGALWWVAVGYERRGGDPGVGRALQATSFTVLGFIFVGLPLIFWLLRAEAPATPESA